MNQQVNEDLVRAIVSILQSSNLPDGSGEVTVSYDVETEDDTIDWEEDVQNVLIDRIDELEAEISDLREELAERTIEDLERENIDLLEEVLILRKENSSFRTAFNAHIDALIELLEDEKYDI